MPASLAVTGCSAVAEPERLEGLLLPPSTVALLSSSRQKNSSWKHEEWNCQGCEGQWTVGVRWGTLESSSVTMPWTMIGLPS